MERGLCERGSLASRLYLAEHVGLQAGAWVTSKMGPEAQPPMPLPREQEEGSN
jgi:hypothetical protein